MSTATSVYRYLDTDGVLIYVGITNRGIQRQAEHVVHSRWWRFVCTQDVEHYDDRATAERRERLLIEKHQPTFNVTHNADHKRRLAAYLKHADVTTERCGHCEECQTATGKDPDYESVGDCVIANGTGRACEHCGSDQCVYPEGHRDGSLAGWVEGFNTGTESAWSAANAQYSPAHQADYLLRAVIDGQWAASGGGHWNMPAAEQSLRDMEADIAEHGIDTLVEKAKVPF